ncbi:hypothetical protein FRC12_019065 [Ceratobasidium sp. 428]|nr:hypothetical protein FRC12_019065 [Ceratobasidium sp. 428]
MESAGGGGRLDPGGLENGARDGRRICFLDHHDLLAGLMENPHEERQAILLARIIKNADKLHEAIIEMNKAVAVSNTMLQDPERSNESLDLQEINTANEDIVIASELFANYRRNVAYNLAATQTTEGSTIGE